MSAFCSEGLEQGRKDGSITDSSPSRNVPATKRPCVCRSLARGDAILLLRSSALNSFGRAAHSVSAGKLGGTVEAPFFLLPLFLLPSFVPPPPPPPLESFYRKRARDKKKEGRKEEAASLQREFEKGGRGGGGGSSRKGIGESSRDAPWMDAGRKNQASQGGVLRPKRCLIPEFKREQGGKDKRRLPSLSLSFLPLSC